MYFQLTDLQRAEESVLNSEHDVKYFKERLASAEAGLKRAKHSLKNEKQRLIPRGRDESPIKYYGRTGQVGDNYTSRFKGYYYCNPAHCSCRWKSEAQRDEHLERAYGALM